MYCTKCGTPNEDTARFCIKCGTQLTPVAARPPAEAGLSGVRRTAILIAALGGLGVLLLVLVIGGGVWLYGRIASDDDKGGEPVEGAAFALTPTVGEGESTVAPLPTPTPVPSPPPITPSALATPLPTSTPQSEAMLTPMLTPTVEPLLSQVAQLGIGRLASAALSPDGLILAAASQDGTVKLWDVGSGQELHALMGHEDRVQQVDFSPSGSIVASLSRDGIKLWDVATGQELHTLSGLKSIAFSPDESTVASLSRGGITFWDVTNGEELRTLEGATGEVQSIAFSPDGSALALVWWGGVTLWNTSDGQVLQNLARHQSGVNSVAFSSDGTTLASASNDRTVKLWDWPSGTELSTLSGHTDSVVSVTFSPEGTTLASGAEDGGVKVWDVTSGQELQTLNGHTASIKSLAFSSDGRILTSASLAGTVKVWDVTNGKELSTLRGHKNPVDTIAFSPDGLILASGACSPKSGSCREGEILLWQVSEGVLLNTLQDSDERQNPGAVVSVAFSPDGRTLASASSNTTVKLWDVTSGQELRTLNQGGHSTKSIAWSPDGRLLAWNFASEVKVWDMDSGQELHTLEGHGNYVVQSVAFSPDGLTLASASYDTNAKLWDVASGQELRTLSAHSAPVDSVAFSPDGRLLASGSEDSTVKLWDLTTGLVSHTLSGHTFWVNSVAFSPDGRILASASEKEMILWDVATGKQLYLIEKSESAVGQRTNVAFSPDGRLLATAMEDGTVRLWELAPELVPATTPVPLAIAATPPASPTAVASAPIAVLKENFTDQQTFSEHWQNFINDGIVTIGSGFLNLSSDASTSFPYVRINENPFPTTGDFTLDIELQYTKVGDFGTGIVLGAKPPENNSPVQAEPDPNVELFKIWQDSSYYNALVVGTADKVFTSLGGPNTDRHNVRFVYTDGLIKVYLDDTLIGEEPEAAPRPTTLWFGNPYRTPQAGSWSELRVFSVSIDSSQSALPANTPASSSGESLPKATPSPTATPTPSCPKEPRGEFHNLWTKYQAQIGCPIQTDPLAGDFVEQPFEGGHMFWYAQADLFIVTMGDNQGDWTFYNEVGWHEGDPPESCTVQVPAGKLQPIRGFGWIWCQDQSIQDRLGWALDVERAFPPGTDLIQGFENGLILRDSDGQTTKKAYVMFGKEQGTFVREPY